MRNQLKFVIHEDGSGDDFWTPFSPRLSDKDRKSVMWYNKSYITDLNTGQYYRATKRAFGANITLEAVNYIPRGFTYENRS